MSCVLDCQAAAAADPAAAQDQPAPAADPGLLLSRPSHVSICYVTAYSGTWPKPLCKVSLSWLVPAGKHAVRNDPGFPPQRPAAPGHPRPPDDTATATNPLQARLVSTFNSTNKHPLIITEQTFSADIALCWLSLELPSCQRCNAPPECFGKRKLALFSSEI